MEPDSLLDQDDSYGKRAPAPAKWQSWGFGRAARQTFLCLLQESELMGGEAVRQLGAV